VIGAVVRALKVSVLHHFRVRLIYIFFRCIFIWLSLG
jgi:hypothetical protein